MMPTAKKSLIYAALGVAGLSVVAGATIGLVFLFHEKKESDASIGERVDFDFAVKTQNADGSWTTTGPSIPGLKISQYETRMPDGSVEYFLNQEGINHLVQRFMDTANYGPEIFNLKRIWIGNHNFTSSQENGVYIGTTDEIALNGENYAKALWEANPNISTSNADGYNSAFKSLYKVTKSAAELRNDQESRAELLFQTLSHEYGHHLSHSYMSSPFRTNIENVYSKNDDGTNVANRFNESFLDEFKSQFHYTNSPEDTSMIVNQSTLNKNSNDKYVGSIGEVYPTGQAWSLANSDAHPTKPWVLTNQQLGTRTLDHLGFYYFNKYSPINSKNLSEQAVLADARRYAYNYSYLYSPNSSTLEYLYSAEELYTRKALLSTTTLDSKTFDNFVGNRVKFDILDDAYKYITPALGNAAGGKNIKLNSNPEGEEFMADNPFSTIDDGTGNSITVAESFTKSIDRYIGHSTGDDISYIWQENPFEVTAKGQATTTQQIDVNNIKFGGYINNNLLNWIGTYSATDVNGAPIDWTPLSEIEILDFKLGYKDHLFDSNRHSLPGDRYFYGTKNYLNRSKISGKALAFATYDPNTKSKTNITLLNSYRGSDSAVGYASTYQEMLPKSLQPKTADGKYVYAIPFANNGKVYINGTFVQDSTWGGAA